MFSVLGSEYDSVDPARLREMAVLLPHERYHHCAEGSNFAMWDDEEEHFEGLRWFLGA